MSTPADGECLSDETIFDLVDGKLDAAAQARAEQHLQGCAACTAGLAELSRFRFGGARPPRPEAPTAITTPEGAAPTPLEPLAEGTVVQRYTAGKVLGVGGGGVVQEAYDPRLRRKVALKLLRPVRAHGVQPEQAQQRLLREAETMARLSHPNVVFVLDAGVLDDRVFIVMELIEGQTLADWAPGRSWTEILGAFVAAGRGLAAVHAAGMAHGDFKPQNVLVGADGRVRVTDFGLARATGAEAASPAAPASAPATGDVYTLAGGTPAYMAPEQLAGQTADARSDQFSFCVALWSALFGRHPSEGPAPEPNPVPAAVHEALAVGLRDSAEQRHPSMTALLDTLEQALPRPDRAVRREAVLRWTAVALAGAAVLGAGAWQARRWLGLGPRCGNGVVERGEECDDGNGRDDDACLSTCRSARCGDGVVRKTVEDCDGGPGCSPSCLLCRSGDASFVWPENGHCYTRHDQAMAWPAARQACSTTGASLVRFDFLAEDKGVADALLKDRPAGYWLGLTRGPRDPEFLWIGGEPWPDNLHEWWQSEPRPATGCAFAEWSPHWFRGYQKRTRWRTTQDCNEPHGFLCEQEPWQTLAKNGHAYRVYDHPVSGPAAIEVCAAAGGHLATLTTSEEHEFATRLVHVAVWLGATRPASSPRFGWITGEAFQFQRFAADEPDQSDAYCMALDKDGLWHDRQCHMTNPALCEID